MGERLLRPARAAFLVIVAGFAWFGLRGRFTEIASALAETSVLGVLAALGLTLVGLGATGMLWLGVMSQLGSPIAARPGLAVFFVGQLGKYVPGSVWSIGAQAEMARGHSVPPRATVTAGLVFLGYHLVTGVVVGATTVLVGGLTTPWPSWLSVLALALGLLGLTPTIVGRSAELVAGQRVSVTVGETMRAVGLMTVAWGAYATALVFLSPSMPWGDLVAFGAAFAISYAVGVVVVLAPAGVGVREAVFVLLLAPVSGPAAATALALLARVVHTAADALAALATWTAESAHRRDRSQAGKTRLRH